jgi:8-hydroxy-5-deazaflavin:NADPH oxidoreductase
MKIAIIGHGNVGGALAGGWAKFGHEVIIGHRDPNDQAWLTLQSKYPTLLGKPIAAAAQLASVIVIAAVPTAVAEIAQALGNCQGKVIIDAMNSVSSAPEGFKSTYDALAHYLPGAQVVKCFNSTGFENMAQPRWGENQAADMFMAGDDAEAKATARQLALDLGFAACYDFGTAQQVPLLEQFALAWINLAIFQQQGRDIVFKVLRRS